LFQLRSHQGKRHQQNLAKRAAREAAEKAAAPAPQKRATVKKTGGGRLDEEEMRIVIVQESVAVNVLAHQLLLLSCSAVKQLQAGP
jgi:hypothetical protein